MVASLRVGAGNCTLALCRSSPTFYLLSHLPYSQSVTLKRVLSTMPISM